MENLNFVAIDFETANEDRSSICEIGLTIVEDSEIIESMSWLVRPEDNMYNPMNIDIHGITPSMTRNSPSFKEVWPEIVPYLENAIVIAHNTAFDMYALRDALNDNGIPYPHFMHYCSCRAAKYVYPNEYSYSLENLCIALDIDYNTHHRAESDSEAAAKLFIQEMEDSGLSSLSEFEEEYEFKCGEFSDNYFRPQRSTKEYKRPEKKKISDYIGDPSKFDEDNYFYGRSVCFTGKCSYGTREEMLQMVADIGGYPSLSVTKSTNILVVGQQDYRVVGEDGMSSKQEKAMKLKDAGQDIEIMSETEFRLLMSKSNKRKSSNVEPILFA